MKKTISLVLAASLLLSSCGMGSGSGETSTNTSFKKLYSAEVETLNYLNSTSEIEMQIAANIVDSLVEYDTLGNVKPSLALDWNVSDDGYVWTFTLREGVKWVDSAGIETGYEVTANDFVTSAKWQLNPANASSNEFLLDGVIKNATQFFNNEITDFNEVGVKAIDNYTLEYTLEKPVPYFLSMLSYAAFLPVNETFLDEKGDTFGTTADTVLYNGAYYLSEFTPNERHVLTANKEYWDKENVYITELVDIFNEEAMTLAPEMFVRGEIQEAMLTSSILVDWKNDKSKQNLVRPSLNEYYSYFYALNFDPQFDAEYEPANWKVAVNNLAFRKSLFHGLDRIKPMTIDEPTNPESRLINTITPPNLVDVEGVDYTEMSGLVNIKDVDTFNEKLALEYKAQAMTELNGKATFPIKVLMPYNSGNTDWAKRAQVVEQQMETLLGTEYIDIILEAGPSTGFLGEVRRPGKYAFMEVNWGPDYADPETYTDPFYVGGSYNKPEFVEGYTDANGEKTYTNLVDVAKAEAIDVEARYINFAKAETFLLENAFVIPYAVNNPGYKASYLNPFETQYAPFGLCYLKFKGRHLLDTPMNTEAFESAKTEWETARTGK